MDVSVNPGKYVIAVSGGVDSVVLLDVLSQQPDLDLVVAHFDHGIRPDSADDANFVEAMARQKNLPFMTERVELGPQASEAAAREARYDFLRRVQQQVGAQAIITAHHRDDFLETAILNLLRGTGRKGATALQDRSDLKRPLLSIPKSDIILYATQQKLSWREDTTNHDERYTRNYIRHRLLVRFDATARQQLLKVLTYLQQVNAEIDVELSDLLARYAGSSGLDRRWFTQLPHDVSREVMASWLRQNGVADFDRRAIERLTVQVKVKQPGKRLDVLRGRSLLLTKDSITFLAGNLERVF